MTANSNKAEELLIFGYLREYQNNHRLSNPIPNPIILIIIIYYKLNLSVYCVGVNKYNLFGMTPFEQIQSGDGPNQIIRKWTLSERLTKYCTNISSITVCNGFYVMKDFNNDNIFINAREENSIFTKVLKRSKKHIACVENLGQMFSKSNNNNVTTDIFKQNDDYIDVISKSKCSINEPHLILVSSKGEFYGFASSTQNVYDALGAGYSQRVPLLRNKVLKSIFKNMKIKSISCGNKFTLFLCKNGSIYSCGVNERGQCGMNNDKNKYHKIITKPTLIKFNENNVKIKDIASGLVHSLAVSDKGKLYIFGWNQYGQLGQDEGTMDYFNQFHIDFKEWSKSDRIMVPKINSFFNDNNIFVNKVDCSFFGSLVIDINGYCYVFGFNNSRQIGLGITKQTVGKPVIVKYNNETVKAVNGVAGSEHYVLISYDYQCIYSFGSNSCCQGGVDTKIHPSRSIYKLTKKDIGIKEEAQIVRVIAGPRSTLLVTKE